MIGEIEEAEWEEVPDNPENLSVQEPLAPNQDPVVKWFKKWWPVLAGLMLIIMISTCTTKLTPEEQRRADVQAAEEASAGKVADQAMADAAVASPKQTTTSGSGVSAETSVPSTFDTGYDTYKVEMYAGPAAPIRWTADAKTYRTRVMEAYREPIVYGGSMVDMGVGCGTECILTFMLDKSSGKMILFPIGGEEQMNTEVRYRADSSLIWASWMEQDEQQPFNRHCYQQPWVLGKSGFKPLAEKKGVKTDPEAVSCLTE